MSENETIRVLVVDDQTLVREGIRALLTEVAGIEVVGEAADGAEAIRQARALKPDVILMDIVMPGMDGIQATRCITAAGDSTEAGATPRVLVLTSFAGDEQVFPALKAGALGYLLKDTRSWDLIQAIRQVYRNESWLAPTIARKVLLEMRQVSGPYHAEALTPRELEVLRLVARGFDDTEIAKHLVISEVTVRSHVSNILGKLHLANRVQATLFALNQGIVSLSGPAGHDPNRS